MLAIELILLKVHCMKWEVREEKSVEGDQKDEIHLQVYSASQWDW